MLSLLAVAASPEGGQRVVGFLIICAVIWFIAWIFRPRDWQINHRSQTTATRI
ncbi:hypothetical protein Pla8534_64890 [Lignipirellula cremea]|uniref:Uncharacterized protein n=1 Tax=Lignipirellula cremea TaxID=2528010 RepID=A0A518E3F2_9BACT|nr:hypothetical protein Pla8534_64890 [Lignipirellula cremea]